jgi:hypothetical protein
MHIEVLPCVEMGGQLQLPVPSVTVTFGLEARWAPIVGLDVMGERKPLPLSGNVGRDS